MIMSTLQSHAEQRLFPVLRLLFWRPARTRRARIMRLVFGVLFVTVLLFRYEPSLLFANEYVHPRFVVHSDAPLGSATRAILDAATEHLRLAGIEDPAYVHRAYICNDGWRMRLLAPASTTAFAMTSPMETIVLNRCDVAADRVFAGDRVRSLSGTLAHEATHTLLRRRYGMLAATRLPHWKCEGLCDYVAGESSFPDDEGRRLLREGADDPSTSFFYFRARLMVEQLIRFERLTFDDVVRRDHEETAVLERLTSRLRATR